MLIRKDLPLKHVTIKAFWHCQSSFARPVILVILICILTPGVYLQPSPALRFAQVTSCRKVYQNLGVADGWGKLSCLIGSDGSVICQVWELQKLEMKNSSVNWRSRTSAT
ncbi:hypothetical protein WN944_009230 [Citrus x changshan-huyou]|uniref:Uncharacterized protein n=1 Tax=Citrus x changshan-huyou TaxID=2935761 RepID=A0AAP0MRS1_9ROSI